MIQITMKRLENINKKEKLIELYTQIWPHIRPLFKYGKTKSDYNIEKKH